VDAVTLELVELEMSELLTEYGFDTKNTPIISGSALCALEDRDPELGEQSIRKLLSAVDEHIVPPSRQLDCPFVLPIEKAFTVPGRGTVVIGTLQCGVINKGDTMELIGYGNQLKTAASDVQVWDANLLLWLLLNPFASIPVAATGFQSQATYYTCRSDGFTAPKCTLLCAPIIVHKKCLSKSVDFLHGYRFVRNKN